MNKEHIKYLVGNKDSIIKKKRALPLKYAMPIGYDIQGEGVKIDAAKAVKIEQGNSDKGNSLNVKVIANLSGWMDSDNDVILRGAYTKTITDKSPDKFPFLKDHKYEIDSIVGDTLAVKTEEYSMRQLGYDSDKSAQALIFKACIYEDYDKGVYAKYRNKAIKQHSIGLRYIKLELAVNDPEFGQEFEMWQKYSDQIVNFAKAEEKGYFWAVQEIALLENSAVVFGANSMTPTLSVEENQKTEAALGTSASESKEVSKIATSDSLEFFKHL